MAASAFALPMAPEFAGLVLQHQVLQLELGGGGGVTSLSCSNGLAASLGAF